jgi:AcrR family transcriptional regulator
MTSDQDRLLQPRKRPTQARSELTVSILFEASIQVLLAVGYRKLTTTRVADRAGVSVGTLYQYFPNRQALIASVIEGYLNDIVSTIERGCQNLHDHCLEELSAGLVESFIAAKSNRLELARAMHEPLADVGGTALVKAATLKTSGFIAGVLRSCRDAKFRDEPLLALLLAMACSSLLQTAMTDRSNVFCLDNLRVHMNAMVLGYLRQMRLPDIEQVAIAPMGSILPEAATYPA